MGGWLLRVAATAAAVFGVAPATAGASGSSLGPPPLPTTAPFQQCTAVYQDPTCGYLVDITNTGNEVLVDPNVGYYDGSDDVLVGVQNDSGGPIGTIHLGVAGSSYGTFAFDGDGLCTPGGDPVPVGCPFGPPGDPGDYFGPDAELSADATSSDSGTVSFPTPLQPGQYTYFSLEALIPGATVVAGATNDVVTTSIGDGTNSAQHLSEAAPVDLTDSATIGGVNASGAAGSVTYSVYSDQACTRLVATGGTKAVSNGAATSDPFGAALPTNATYYVQVAYTGDGGAPANNDATSTNCGDETVTFGAPSRSPPQCISQVTASPNVTAKTTSGCFTQSGSAYSSSSPILLDGLQAKPGPGGSVSVDTTGHVLTLGPGGEIAFDDIPLERFLTAASVDLTKPVPFVNPPATFHGFPFSGSFFAQFNADQTVTLQPTVSLKVLGDNLTTELDLEASNQGGVDFGGFRVHFSDAIVDPRYSAGQICNPKNSTQASGWDCQPDPRLKNGQGHLKAVGNTQVKLGFLPISDFDLGYHKHGPHGQGEWIGSVTFQMSSLFPGAIKTVKVVMLPTVNANADLITVPKLRVYSVGAQLDNLNVPIPPADGVFLQDIGFQLGFNPLLVGGTVGISLGPGIAKAPLGIVGHFTYMAGKTQGWDLKATGELSAFKQLKLASAHVELDSRDKGVKVTLGGEVGGQYGPFDLKGSLDGALAFDPFHFQLGGNGSIAFAGQGVNVAVLASDAGLGACGHLDVLFVHTDVGFTHRWNGPWTFFSCDFSGLYTVGGGSASSATAGRTVQLPGGLAREEFSVSGRSGPPSIKLTGPAGFSVTSPAPGQLRLKPGVLAYSEPQSDATYFIIEHPKGGRWRLTPLPGSPGTASFLRADPLQPLNVSARVRGAGHQRTLSYSFRSQRGQSVTLIESGRATSHTLATSVTHSGHRSFTPAPGPAGKRSIVALISIDGILRRIETAARYQANSTPLAGRPQRPAYSVRAGVLKVSWGTAHLETGYEIDVLLANRSTLRLVLGGRARRVATRLPAGAQIRRVTVTAEDLGWYGTPVTAKRTRGR